MVLMALFGIKPSLSIRIIGFVILLKFAKWFTRVDKKLVVFASDSVAHANGNIKLVRDHLASLNLPIEIQNSVRANLATRRTWRKKFELIRLLATAQVVVLDDNFPEAYVEKRPARTSMIQLWHAAGAFKKIGHSRFGQPNGPGRWSVAHRGYTGAIVSSEAIVHDYEEAYKASPGVVSPLGIPKTDPLFDSAHVSHTAKDVREKYNIPSGNRIVLFAPTFRGTHQHEAHYDPSWVDWREIAATPQFEKTTFLIKHHPFVRDLSGNAPKIHNVIDVSDDTDMTSFLCAADVLITDYSSSIFEYSLLDRPMIFFCPDLEDYIDDRGFYYPLEEYLCGPIAHNQAELVEALSAKKPSLDKVRELRHKFMDACDGHSTQRVVEQLILPALDLTP